jgi:hypothetical protein
LTENTKGADLGNMTDLHKSYNATEKINNGGEDERFYDPNA